MWPNPQENTDLVTFNEENLNRKLSFSCAVMSARTVIAKLAQQEDSGAIIQFRITWRILINVWKVFVFGVLLVRIFPHSEWVRRETEYFSVFSPTVGEYGPEKLRIRTLFTKWIMLFSFKKCAFEKRRQAHVNKKVVTKLRQQQASDTNW